jgi:filamentous hemagglutinin
MRRRLTLLLAAALLLAGPAASALADRGAGPGQNRAAASPASAAASASRPAQQQQAQQQAPARPAAAGSLVVRNVVVRDVDGRVAWRGDVDLRPTLRRIASGVRDKHRNDGGVFGNRERLLPARSRGYYREYVVRTPGITHAGPQRLILGTGGEVYYTPDHYATFKRVR